jgi:hypothetical protein
MMDIPPEKLKKFLSVSVQFFELRFELELTMHRLFLPWNSFTSSLWVLSDYQSSVFYHA